MKKKLLLVGVAAMGLLAVGVGATSTFAWFSVNHTVGTAQIESNKSVLTVTNAAVDVSVGLEHLFTVSVSSGSVIDGLARYENLSSNPNLTTGYIDSSDHFVSLHGTAGKTLSSTLSISVSINWKLKTAAPTTWGWDASYANYTENDVTYTRAEIEADIATITNAKVFVKPTTDANNGIKFYETTAASDGSGGDKDFGDMGEVTTEGALTEKKVNNVTGHAAKDYLFFDTLDLSAFVNAKQDDVSQASASTDQNGVHYYVYGGDGDKKNTTDVSGSIDIMILG